MDTEQVIFTTCSTDAVSTVCAWKAQSGTLLSRYRGGGVCHSHCIAVGGGYLLCGEKDKSKMRAWRYNKQHFENIRLIAPGKVNALAMSDDSIDIALAVGEKVFLYQSSSGRQIGVGSRHFQPITVIKFTIDGTLLACGGEDGVITVWKTCSFSLKQNDPEPFYSFSNHSLPISDMIYTSGDIRSRLISVSMDRTCNIYDMVSGLMLLSIVFPVQLSSVAISPVELELFIGNSEGGIHEFSFRGPPRSLEHHLQNDERLPMYVGHADAVTSVCCTLDCCNLISGSLDGTVKIWHIGSAQCMKTINLKGPVTNVLLMLLPENAFAYKFQPDAIIHDFINSENAHDSEMNDKEPSGAKEEEEMTFGIMVTEDMMPSAAIKHHPQRASNYESNLLKEEIDKIKSINNTIFRYAVTKVIDKVYKKNRISLEDDLMNPVGTPVKNVRKKNSNKVVGCPRRAIPLDESFERSKILDRAYKKELRSVKYDLMLYEDTPVKNVKKKNNKKVVGCPKRAIPTNQFIEGTMSSVTSPDRVVKRKLGCAEKGPKMPGKVPEKGKKKMKGSVIKSKKSNKKARVDSSNDTQQ